MPVPLASGLLAGKLISDTRFERDDHRQFNRHGEAFDQGETFSGVDYDIGLAAVKQLQSMVPAGATLAQWALRWILMFDAVSCVIPGASTAAGGRERRRFRTAAVFGIGDVGDSAFVQSDDSTIRASAVVALHESSPFGIRSECSKICRSLAVSPLH